MDNLKNDEYYIRKVLTDLEFIVTNTKNISEEELYRNAILVDSIMFRLIQISENSDKLTEEFKEQNKNLPWRAMKGMRNRIVHDYGDVDLSVIFDTVKKDIPELCDILSGIISDLF